jgi:TipAS antibiotic-recognition domain
MDVKCLNLWNRWMLSEENNPVVVECKRRLSEYTKDDWKIMSKEATDMTQMLGELIRYNIPVDSHLATLAFYEYVEHFNKWFLKVDKEFLIKTAYYAKFEKDFGAFFDQFYPGLGIYLFDLIMFNVRKA